MLGYSQSHRIDFLRLIFSEPEVQSSAHEAWQDYLQKMSELGDVILTNEFPNATDRDRAEGFRQLAHMMVVGMLLEFDHADPAFPSFAAHNTDTTGWGGPNIDNKYFRAPIDAQYSYRLTGNVTSLHDVAIQTIEGDFHLGKVGASKVFTAETLTTDDAGYFELTISATKPDSGDWLPFDPTHKQLIMRAYYSDWSKHTDGEF